MAPHVFFRISLTKHTDPHYDEFVITFSADRGSVPELTAQRIVVIII